MSTKSIQWCEPAAAFVWRQSFAIGIGRFGNAVLMTNEIVKHAIKSSTHVYVHLEKEQFFFQLKI